MKKKDLQDTFRRMQGYKLEIEKNKIDAKGLYIEYQKAFTKYSKCLKMIKECEQKIIDLV